MSKKITLHFYEGDGVGSLVGEAAEDMFLSEQMKEAGFNFSIVKNPGANYGGAPPGLRFSGGGYFPTMCSSPNYASFANLKGPLIAVCASTLASCTLQDYSYPTLGIPRVKHKPVYLADHLIDQIPGPIPGVNALNLYTSIYMQAEKLKHDQLIAEKAGWDLEPPDEEKLQKLEEAIAKNTKSGGPPMVDVVNVRTLSNGTDALQCMINSPVFNITDRPNLKVLATVKGLRPDEIHAFSFVDTNRKLFCLGGHIETSFLKENGFYSRANTAGLLFSPAARSLTDDSKKNKKQLAASRKQAIALVKEGIDLITPSTP